MFLAYLVIEQSYSKHSYLRVYSVRVIKNRDDSELSKNVTPILESFSNNVKFNFDQSPESLLISKISVNFSFL